MEDKEKGLKKETKPLTWIVMVMIGGIVFTAFKNGFEGKPYLLFESNESKRIRVTQECEQEGYERAASLRDSNLRVLKAKTSPTPLDLAEIQRIESWQKEGLTSRDDIDHYSKKCMDRYGY